MTVTEAPSCARDDSTSVAVTRTGSVCRTSGVCSTSCAAAVVTASARAPMVTTVRIMLHSFSAKGLEDCSPGRFPDSWIDATAHAFPSPADGNSGSRSRRDLDGAPHSQWRDRAGFSPASLAPGARSHADTLRPHPLSYASWTTGRPLGLLSTVT